MNTKRSWHFGENIEFDTSDSVIVVRIPASISTKQELFQVYDSSLKLPDYFGGNWDAFEECIRDLSWVSVQRIVLAHCGVPFASDHEMLRTYLLILSGASDKWDGQSVHNLEIWFPQESESTIRREMRGRSSK